MPASIPDGEQTLTLRLPTEEQALAPVSEAQSVTVRETETTLAINATGGNDEIAVNGTLATGTGVGVEGQPVQIRIEGSTVGTVTTAADGSFSETFAVPDTVDEEVVRVSAAYRGAGSNLAGSEDETVVSITLASQGVDGASNTADGVLDGASNTADGVLDGASNTADGVPVWLWGLLVVVLSSILGLAWLVRTRPLEELPFSDHPVARSLFGSLGPDSDDSASPSPDAKSEATTDEQSGQPAAAALLQRASTELQSESYGTAVQASYSAVRQSLAARIGGTEALTHWEFYQAYSEAEQTDSALDALRELTEEYERAAFSGDSVTQEHAQRVLARAKELCQVDAPSDSSPTADD